jgi:hypothetical protein
VDSRSITRLNIHRQAGNVLKDNDSSIEEATLKSTDYTHKTHSHAKHDRMHRYANLGCIAFQELEVGYSCVDLLKAL